MHNSQTPPVGTGNEEIVIKLPRRIRFKSNPDILQTISTVHTPGHGGISSAENTPAPSVGKQSSAPGTPTPRAYGYLTDDTEESYDGHNHVVSPHLGAVRKNSNSGTPLSKREHIEIIKVQSQLKKWLGDKTELILPEFIELMQKIAPHVSLQDATQMFNRVDRFDDGQIHTNVLLHDEFLPRMILEVFREDDVDTTDVEEEEVANAPYLDMDKKQLYEENVRLKTWIREQGQPAVEKAQHLEGILVIYENERGNAQLEAQKRLTIQQQLNHLKVELDDHVSDAEAFAEDNRKLRVAMMESQANWQALQDQLKRKEKELKQYKKLAKELQTINEKYVKKNEQLTESKQKIEEEAQELRQQILQYEHEVVQIYYDQQAEMENIQHEFQELQTDLDENQISAANAAAAAADITSIGERFNRTITINRAALNENTMDEVLESHHDEQQTSINSYIQMHSLENQSSNTSQYSFQGGGPWPSSGSFKVRGRPIYRHKSLKVMPASSGSVKKTVTPSLGDQARSSRSFTTDDIESSGDSGNVKTKEAKRAKSDRASDDELENDTLFMQTYGASADPSPEPPDGRRPRHKHVQSRSMDLHTLQRMASNVTNVFEDAMTVEFKNEMKTQIRVELMEDFQLKLQQKDIENRWKLNKQKEKIEAERQELIDKYEQLIAKYERDLNTNNVADERRSDEQDDYKINVHVGQMDHLLVHSLQIADRASVDASSLHRRKGERKVSKPQKEGKWELDFWAKIEKLYNSSSVMWSLPLYKL